MLILLGTLTKKRRFLKDCSYFLEEMPYGLRKNNYCEDYR